MPIAKVGQRAQSAGVAVTVVKVSTAKQISIWKPDAGYIYLDIDVIIENTSREKAPYNPLYFKVKDSDGFEFTSAITALDPSLKSGELSQGDKARGHVAFEVPSNSGGFVVSYEPLVLFGDYEPIQVDLGK